MSKSWSNLGKIVFRRTYSRKDSGTNESLRQAAERTIAGNVKGLNVSESEQKELLKLMVEHKAGPAGRGWWFSGAPAQFRIGGAALNNCWYFNASEWENFVIAQDLLMLGGGVGLSVEHRFVSKLPKIRKGVKIEHKLTKDADFIVPDSREGWNELIYRVLESYFVTGKSFTFSTICIRGAGEAIAGFGGTASGPIDLIKLVENLGKILNPRAGKNVRPIDTADIICAIGEMVVAGNVRRSAIIIIGDPHDKDYLKAKRWDLGILPSWRGKANFSVVCDDVDDLHPLFWKTYEEGEPFGLVNRTNMRKYGRMGELKADKAEGVNPCVPGYTPILTDEGYKPIGRLIGQKVNVWNGFEWSEVEPRVTGYNQSLVKVVLSDGRSLVCTEAHEFVLARGYRGQTYKVKAVDLLSGDKLIKHSFPIMESGEDLATAYTQGFISADGMDGYSYACLYGDKIKCAPYLLSSFSTWEPNNKRLRTHFNFEARPKTFVPMAASVKSRLDWFAGLLDGDGTVLKEGGSQIASVNEAFLLDVQRMLTTVGVQSKVTLAREASDKSMPDGSGGYAIYPCQALYRLLVGAVEMQHLISLGLTTHRTNFIGFTPQRNAGQFVKVVSVTPAGIAGTVYCFTEPKRNLGCFNGVVTGQCAEATLENGEPCNLTEQALCNMESETEFFRSSRLMHRWAKRVTMAHYHHPVSAEVVARNRRTGAGITGILNSPLYDPKILTYAYYEIQKEDETYSAELGIPTSIRTTVVKPSGTRSKVMDCGGYEGAHAPLSRYMIQRIRFAAHDALVPLLKAAGHHVEFDIKLDGKRDHSTVVVEFYVAAPQGFPVVDEGWDMWKQLETVKMLQTNWADQAVSVTVYYRRDQIPALKLWLADNLKYLKTISFLLETGHGFKLAPKEAITEQQFETLSKKVKPLELEQITDGDLGDSMECDGGICPVR